MPRVLRTTFALLDLQEETFRTRDGGELGDCPRSDGVAWDLVAPLHMVGDDFGGAGWAHSAPGDTFGARARLEAVGGLYPVDETARTASSPLLGPAAGLRAWQGIELFYYQPTDTEILFRVEDADEVARWWNGAAWATATTDGHWNDAADVQEHFSALASTVRSLRVVARLATLDDGATPAFYGARVAYGCREASDLDDALLRTLLASLRSSLMVTGYLEREADGTSTLPVGDEQLLDVRELQGAWNLTADPNELSDLAPAASLAAGNVTASTPTPAVMTWDAGDVPDAGDVVRVEFGYVPLLVVAQHRDIQSLDRLPAVYIAPQASALEPGQGEPMLVRDLAASPPTATALAVPDLLTVRLELRVVAELSTEVQRVITALRAWLGGARGRTLVSPETARIVEVRELDDFEASTAALAQGVHEARATWALIFQSSRALAASATTLVREGGIDIAAEES